MWGLIAGALQGIVTGIVGPVFTYLGKKQDTTLEGAKAGMTADQANNAAWLDYNYKIEALKLQQVQWWGPRLLYMIVGGSAAMHFSAVMLDSVPFGIPFLFAHVIGSWKVPKLPAPYDTYEGWVVASLFVVSLTKGPLSALTTWMQKR